MDDEQRQKVSNSGGLRAAIDPDEINKIGAVNTKIGAVHKVNGTIFWLVVLIAIEFIVALIAGLSGADNVVSVCGMAMLIEVGIGIWYTSWKTLCVLLDIRDRDQIKERYDKAKQARREAKQTTE